MWKWVIGALVALGSAVRLYWRPYLAWIGFSIWLLGMIGLAKGAVLGEQRLIILDVCFSDYCPQAWTPQQMADLVNGSVNAFYNENANQGQLINPPYFTATSQGWWVLPIMQADCNTSILDAAIAAASAHGIDATSWPYIMLSYPARQSFCPSDIPRGTVGQQLPGRPYAVTWLPKASLATWTHAAHELGHNLRNLHAHAILCGAIPLAADISTCTIDDGGWYADIMGQGIAGHFNAWFKIQMGWVTPLDVIVSGSYTLRPTEQYPDALRIARGPNQWLLVERRQAIGYDSSLANIIPPNYLTGVVVTLGTSHCCNTDGGVLYDADEIDFTPGDNQRANGALLIGQSWTDPGSSVVLQVTASVLGGAATVQVTIPGQPPVNQPPVANNDTATTPVNTSVLVNVRANDTDSDGDSLTVAAVTQPAHGTAAIESNSVRYTPALNYTGGDAFQYTISDGQGHTAVGTVTVTVTAPANSPPLANPDSAMIAPGQSTLIPVLANDSDPDGDPLTITSVTQPSKGTAVIEGTQVRYTAPARWKGPGVTSFTYTISDGRGGTASATVTVTRL
jgi:hypothetical protein